MHANSHKQGTSPHPSANLGAALHACADRQVDGLVTDPGLPGEGPMGSKAIAHEQNVLVNDEIEGLARAVARHQDADLFIGNAALMALDRMRRTSLVQTVLQA